MNRAHGGWQRWYSMALSPQGEQSSTVGSRRSANGWIASEICSYWARKLQQRRAMWPLREGREIWGVDGTFASMSWRRCGVRDGVAPSANELAWFYRGFRHRSRRRHSQSVKHAALSEPLIENPLISILRHTVLKLNVNFLCNPIKCQCFITFAFERKCWKENSFTMFLLVQYSLSLRPNGCFKRQFCWFG